MNLFDSSPDPEASVGDMNTPSSRYLTYEEGFNNVRGIMLRGFKRLESEGFEAAFGTSVEMEGELSEAEGYLEAMGAEVKSMVYVEKTKFEPRLGRLRNDFKGLTERLKTTFGSLQKAAAANPSSSHKALTSSNTRLDRATGLLDDSLATIANTDTIGDATLEDLGRQKAALERGRDRVEDTQGITSAAARLLKEMANRAVRHKVHACDNTCFHVLPHIIAHITPLFLSPSLPLSLYLCPHRPHHQACVGFMILLMAFFNGLVIYYGFQKKDK
jgi:hypothetical protein